MDGSHGKDGASKFMWRWRKKCSFFLQVIRMILDLKGLIDQIKKQNNVKWY